MILLKVKIVILITLLFLIGEVTAQSERSFYTDKSSAQVQTLLADLEVSKDTQRVKILNELAWTFHSLNPSKAQEYAERAMLLSKELNYNIGLKNAFHNQGLIYHILGNYQQSLIAHLECAKISENIQDDISLSVAYQNIGLVFKEKQDYPKALDFYTRSLKIAQRKGNQLRIANPLNDIGEVYALTKNYSKAIDSYEKAYKIYESLKDSSGIALTSYCLGKVYLTQQKYFVALKYLLKSLQIYEKLLDWTNVALLTQKIGDTYLKLDNLTQAEKLSRKSLEIAQKYKLKTISREAMKALSEIYGRKQNWQQAYIYQNKYIALQDSIYQEEKLKQINEMQKIFEQQKEQARLELLKKEEIIQKDEKIIKSIFNYGVWVALIFISLFAFSLYRNNYRGRNANKRLKQQKLEITTQKNAIEEKHNEITEKNNEFEQLLEELKRNNIRLTDSIRYAERIQRAILPATQSLRDNFTDHFVIFKPKDVVSGDFYWFSRIEKENTSFLAVVDCTGHGVPGAFMSMIGNTLLGEIVNHEKIYETNEILRQLHEGVRDSLKQNNNQNTDGMDISLCRIESLENEEYKIQFSGAKSQLYLYKDEEITEIRGDRKSIGGWQREAIRSFSKQELILKKGDCLFLATDGYTDAADQKRKKIGYKLLKKTLAENANLSMTEQGAALLEILYEHQKRVEQRDDITLIGVRL